MERMMSISTPTEQRRPLVSKIRHHQEYRTAARQRTRSLAGGANLFREGDEAQRLYEVTDGILRLTRFQESGKRQVIAFCYPGDIVGFPRSGLHCADCSAVVPAQVNIYGAAILEDGYSHPDLHQRLLKAALLEISSMQDHFLTLGRRLAAEKLASFLLHSADRVGKPLGTYTQLELPMSRVDIADYLGLTPETVSRTFTQFRDMKAIMLDHIYTVILLDRGRLKALAEASD
jgi:CRP-like cAMP-binding protein